MNITLLSLTLACLLGLGVVVGIVALNFLAGTFEFFFGKPKLEILKSESGQNGLAFALRWDGSKEPARFEQIKLRLFNPFGSPTQVDVSKSFDAKSSTFALDLDMGPAMQDLLGPKNSDRALIQVEVGSAKDRFFFQKEFKANQFFDLRKAAQLTAKDFNNKLEAKADKQYYYTVEKSMVAPATNSGAKAALKLATNPEFAGAFAPATGGAEGATGAAPAANFAVTKVWIEPGCIVCNACEGIYPEVFKVNADTCIVKADYPKDDGLKVKEAAEACPVEVIKFTVAS